MDGALPRTPSVSTASTAAFAAVGSARTAWATGDAGGDLRALVNQAFDLLGPGRASIEIEPAHEDR
jgi:hypothetical protein